MVIAISLLVGIYFVVVILFSRRIDVQFSLDVEEEITGYRRQYQKLEDQEEALLKTRQNLEDEAAQIFTLYEITKEITKNLRQDDAIAKFKEKLREYVFYQECLFIEALSKDYKAVKDSKEYYIFTLKVKRRKIGYIALKGVREDDYEKIKILGNQFSLALWRVELYQELERIAITDGLTEVNTRRYIMERLDEEIKRSRARKIKMSFLMIDVDHFKNFNDQYGHLTGDYILREIGSIIKDNIREIDIAGRYGGEEFCVILPDTGVEGAKYAAERIRRAAEEASIKAYDATVKVTLSIGVSTFPDNSERLEEVIDKADWALYGPKSKGAIAFAYSANIPHSIFRYFCHFTDKTLYININKIATF